MADMNKTTSQINPNNPQDDVTSKSKIDEELELGKKITSSAQNQENYW